MHLWNLTLSVSKGVMMKFSEWFDRFCKDDKALKTMALLAWQAGAQAERNAIIKLCEEFGAWNKTAQDIADDIRMRGKR